MSTLSEAMYGDLDRVYDMLNCESVNLQETQGALANVIGRVRVLSERIDNLEFRLAGLEEQRP